ncbi:MAG: T9SS type A sorting domain-containing protein [Parafilimonas sp.]
MKKYPCLYLPVFLLLIFNASAQIKINSQVSPPGKIVLPYQIPRVENAGKKITVFQIAPKQPGVINVQPKFNVRSSGEQCALLNSITSSLKLEGERSAASLVNLKWEAKELYDRKGFEIQRSFVDTTHFKTVAFVTAYAEASAKEKYTAIDLNDNIQPAYYRLKQLKLDSGYAYSNIVLVKGIMQLTLFPNPASDVLYLKLQSLQTNDATIMIYDNKGVLLIKQSTNLIKDIINIKTVSIHSLPAGMYNVKLVHADITLYADKFIKE